MAETRPQIYLSETSGIFGSMLHLGVHKAICNSQASLFLSRDLIKQNKTNNKNITITNIKTHFYKGTYSLFKRPGHVAHSARLPHPSCLRLFSKLPLRMAQPGRFFQDLTREGTKWLENWSTGLTLGAFCIIFRA